MVTPAAGEVSFVRFPFSDLSQSKLRPAVCLADAGRGDWGMHGSTRSGGRHSLASLARAP